MKLKSLLFKTTHYHKPCETTSNKKSGIETKGLSVAESFIFSITVLPLISDKCCPNQVKIKLAHDHHLKHDVKNNEKKESLFDS